MRSIKAEANALHGKVQDYKPRNSGQAQFDIQEIRIRVGEDRVVKLLPVPDESTDGLFFEAGLHWVGGEMVVCPGRVCKTDKRGFCHASKKLYKSLDQASSSEEEAIRREAGLLRRKVNHIYYAMDVSPAFYSGGDYKVPECYGDDNKRETEPSCHECPFKKQCKDKYYFIRYNFGSKGKSNGEKLMSAYNDDVDILESVYATTTKKGSKIVKSRPIKIKVSGSEYKLADYAMQPSLKEVSIPVKALERVDKAMKTVKEMIIDVATIPTEELLSRMGDELSNESPIETAEANGGTPIPFDGEEEAEEEAPQKPKCFADSAWFERDVPPCNVCGVVDECEAAFS